MKACKSCWKLMLPGDWYDSIPELCKPCHHDRTSSRRKQALAAGTHATCRKCRTLRRIELLEDKLCHVCRGVAKPCVSTSEKTCSKCKKTLPTSEFYSRGAGFRSQCKKCCKPGARRICKLCGGLKRKAGFGQSRWAENDRRCLDCAPLKRQVSREEILEEFEFATTFHSRDRAIKWVADQYGYWPQSVEQILKDLQ